MIAVGRRIQEAIDHMGKGETMLALTPLHALLWILPLSATLASSGQAAQASSGLFKKIYG